MKQEGCWWPIWELAMRSPAPMERGSPGAQLGRGIEFLVFAIFFFISPSPPPLKIELVVAMQPLQPDLPTAFLFFCLGFF